jgi:microcystin-dependent protein
MAYEIRYSDFVNKGSIVIDDNTINQETSLKLPGRNTTAYGSSISENFLHLLENFANSTQPVNPVEGQLWYDNSPGVDQLKLWDGSTWVAAGGLKKANIAPDASNSVIGDLWVDTDNQQLYLFAGSGWVLVGPEFADGLATGSRPAEVVSTNNETFDVVFVEVDGKPIAIVANDAFQPKSTIEGFESGLRPGVNLSSFDSGDGVPQFSGVSEKALNLYVPGASEATSTTITAANVMRKDAVNTTNFGINIKNNLGVAVGISNELKLKVDGQAGVLQHDISGSNLQIRMNNAGTTATVVTVDSTQKVGINNPSPQQELDVSGVIQTDTQLNVTSLTDSNGISGGSIVTSGGVGIAKNLNVGGISKINGPLIVGKPDLLNPDTLSVNPTSAAILPDINNLRTIGQPDKVFSAMYSTEFVGSLRGDVQGSVSGRAGRADRLSSPTIFRMTGQVTANNISFDGQQGTVTFNTEIDNTFIANQPGAYADGRTVPSEGTDSFIVDKGAQGVFKMPRDRILGGVKALVPIGTIIPYAGIINDVDIPIPEGWLVCDGSNYLISQYSALHAKIKWAFKSQDQVQRETGNGEDWFAVPDLRGRLPLGADNMGSRGAANVTTNAAADTLGASSGEEQVTLDINNLPEHEHNMINDGGNGSQFYAFSDDPNVVTDNKTTIVADLVGNASGALYEGTGGVDTNTTLGQPIDIMNPFLTLNYLIYAGDEL